MQAPFQSENHARSGLIGGFRSAFTLGRFSYSAISSLSCSMLQCWPGAHSGIGPPSPACSFNCSMLQGLPGAHSGIGPPSPACSFNCSMLQGLPGAHSGIGPPSPACSFNCSMLQGLPGAHSGIGPPSPACRRNWSPSPGTNAIDQAPLAAMTDGAIGLAGIGVVEAPRIQAHNSIQVTRIKTFFIQVLLVVIEPSS